MAATKEWANTEWFRNTEWNPEIEVRFFKKLLRARDKAQYLKLQAYYLTESHPKVTLALVDKFLALGEDFFLADAHLASANAYLALGQTSEAISSFRKALEAERQHPATGRLRGASLLFSSRIVASNQNSMRLCGY